MSLWYLISCTVQSNEMSYLVCCAVQSNEMPILCLAQFIPMPVLFGVFLYMGVSSLKGMQLIDRIMIMLMPPKYQPDFMYLRHVRTKRVHLFTAMQVLCLSFLWAIKSIKEISIAFPVMVSVFVIIILKLVVYPLQDVAVDPSLNWLFMTFLAWDPCRGYGVRTVRDSSPPPLPPSPTRGAWVSVVKSV